jgi:hypothetical protein
MEIQHPKVASAKKIVFQAKGTVGFMRHSRTWHLQDQDVGIVFEDTLLMKEMNPARVAIELRRRNLELSRENARLAAEKAAAVRESQELSQELGEVIDLMSALQIEFAGFKTTIGEVEISRSKLRPFWALATSESRLLLAIVFIRGSVDFRAVLESGDNEEMLEAVCRLRVAGFIRFNTHKIFITATGEEFAKRLGFTK